MDAVPDALGTAAASAQLHLNSCDGSGNNSMNYSTSAQGSTKAVRHTVLQPDHDVLSLNIPIAEHAVTSGCNLSATEAECDM